MLAVCNKIAISVQSANKWSRQEGVHERKPNVVTGFRHPPGGLIPLNPTLNHTSISAYGRWLGINYEPVFTVKLSMGIWRDRA